MPTAQPPHQPWSLRHPTIAMAPGFPVAVVIVIMLLLPTDLVAQVVDDLFFGYTPAGPTLPPLLRGTGWMCVLTGIMLLWVLQDLWRRETSSRWAAVAATVGAALLWFAVLWWGVWPAILALTILPWYLATRQIRPGEHRAGGRMAHVLRCFVPWWTVWCGPLLIADISALFGLIHDPRTAIPVFRTPGRADVLRILGAISPTVGAWVAVSAGALVLARWLSRPDLVEQGVPNVPATRER